MLAAAPDADAEALAERLLNAWHSCSCRAMGLLLLRDGQGGQDGDDDDSNNEMDGFEDGDANLSSSSSALVAVAGGGGWEGLFLGAARRSGTVAAALGQRVADLAAGHAPRTGGLADAAQAVSLAALAASPLLGPTDCEALLARLCRAAKHAAVEAAARAAVVAQAAALLGGGGATKSYDDENEGGRAPPASSAAAAIRDSIAKATAAPVAAVDRVQVGAPSGSSSSSSSSSRRSSSSSSSLFGSGNSIPRP